MTVTGLPALPVAAEPSAKAADGALVTQQADSGGPLQRWMLG
ncbi:hypothetical protein [Streptacidiphilus melanogenes]|nr:hypothetical protein [Streptacidiphilus melanogenes]